MKHALKKLFVILATHPRFYLSLFFVLLDSPHRISFLGSILVYVSFLWFLIIGTPSQVLSQLIFFVLWFLIIGTPSQVLFPFILCSFGFSSLVRHPMFYLSLIVCSFGFSSLGHYPRFLSKFFLYAFGFSSLEHQCRFYLNLFFVDLISHHWVDTLCSI